MEIVRVHCNSCRQVTRHEVRYTHTRRDEIEEGPGFYYWDETRYRMLVCLGCESGTLEQGSTSSGMEDYSGEQIWETQYFPDRILGKLSPKKYSKLNSRLDGLYREVTSAFNGGQRTLCAIGLRTLVEGICAEKVAAGPRASLEAKINGLGKVLPENIVRNLHAFRFMGNRAAHELSAPTQDDLSLAISVVEDLLNFLYELDYKSSQLASKQPGTTGLATRATISPG